jgi:hypothetical protein
MLFFAATPLEIVVGQFAAEVVEADDVFFVAVASLVSVIVLCWER